MQVVAVLTRRADAAEARVLLDKYQRESRGRSSVVVEKKLKAAAAGHAGVVLDLSGKNLCDEELIRLAFALQDDVCFRQLLLRGNKIEGDAALDAVIAMMSTNVSLGLIDLSQCLREFVISARLLDV